MEQSSEKGEERRTDEMQEEQMPVQSEWDDSAKASSEPVLLSDFEHKAFLVNPSKNRLLNIDDTYDKDYSLSVLDTDEAFFLGIKANCVSDWYSLGFVNLAKQRQVHLKEKFAIRRSVAGIERFLQTGMANVTTEMDLLSSSIKPEQAVEKKTGSSLSGVKKWFNP